MRSELARLLARQYGVARHEDVSKPWILPNAARAGKMVQLFPGVYVEKQRRHEEHVRRVAALRYVNGRGALSHTTALAVWRIGWDEPPRAPIHATVPPPVRLPGAKGLVLHRHRGFGETLRRGGLTVVPLDEALVHSWPLLPDSQRAGVVISLITGHDLTAAAVTRRLAETPKLAGAAELRRVLRLLAAGCHSPLELWGALNVFTGPGMPPLLRQYPVAGYRLDLYAERERVAFELDGAKFHSGKVERERDLRRDATLAALGIQVVRFTYDRLMSEPDEVRRQVLAILAARRSR
ncbi:MAG TPA: DUF559 domain-containing protein [Candidatus Limnocylindrales bacterium]|nr:DUF559 domain-containing protein [Candidatus Limnocylindrales bacterium]